MKLVSVNPLAEQWEHDLSRVPTADLTEVIPAVLDATAEHRRLPVPEVIVVRKVVTKTRYSHVFWVGVFGYVVGFAQAVYMIRGGFT